MRLTRNGNDRRVYILHRGARGIGSITKYDPIIKRYYDNHFYNDVV